MNIAEILKKNKINKQDQYAKEKKPPEASFHFFDEEAARKKREEQAKEEEAEREASKKALEAIDYGMEQEDDPMKRAEAVLEGRSADPTDDTIKTLDQLFAVERDIEKLVRDKLKELSGKNEIKFNDNPTTEEEIAEQQKVKAKTEELISSAIVHYTKDPNTEYSFINQEHTKILKKRCLDEIIGFGPITDLLYDESIAEIKINRCDQTFIERNGEDMLADIRFWDDRHIVNTANRILRLIGRTATEETPIVDGRLPSMGFRINVTTPPISLKGVYMTIRKFPKKVWTTDDMVRLKSAPQSVYDFMGHCVRVHRNIFVSGGTGSGKTTLLNALSNCMDDDERIVTIEDSAELKLVGSHVLSEEARKGEKAITIRDLVKNTLRQTARRVVVGECRGAEALDMLQVMNTGHDGSMTTLHANDPAGALVRLEYMCAMAGDLPLSAVRPQIAAACNIIVQIGKIVVNKRSIRRVMTITEVEKRLDENGNYVLHDIFDSKFYGHDKHALAPTGWIPTFFDELEDKFGYTKDFFKKPAPEDMPKIELS